MKQLLYTVTIIAALAAETGAQCTMNSAVADVTLQCSGGTGNRTGVAFNPNQNLYYSVNAGSSGYPLETFSVTGGAALSSTNQGADYRNIWWNPVNNSIEGNTYNSAGVYSDALALSTFYATGIPAYAGPSTMPNAQSQSHADFGANLLLSYNGGSIYKYNKTSGALISTIAITGLPVSTTNINTYGIAFTGLSGSEVALYDYVNQSIYFINYTTGAYVSTCTLPATAPVPVTFRTGFANNRFFLFDTGTNAWYGYPIVNAAAGPTITAIASTPSVCSGGSVNLTAGGASSYTWSTGAASQAIVVSPTVNATFTVIGTNTAGCVGENTISIIVNPGSSVSAVASETAICDGISTTLTASGVNTYSWDNGSQSQAIVVTPSITSTFTVAGTNSLGCNTSAELTITVHQLPTITTIVSPTLLCVGDIATITAQGALSYTWSGGSNGSTYTVNPVISSLINVGGENVFGCVNSVTVNVPVNTNSLSLTADTAICLGSAVTLTLDGVSTQTWSTLSNFAAITVTPQNSTSYSVSGYDQHDCLLSNTVQITVKPKPTVQAGTSKSSVCKGEAVTFTATGGSSYLWYNGSASASVVVIHTVDIVHTYTVTGFNEDGCSDEVSFSVNVGRCTGLPQENGYNTASFFPNPFYESFEVRSEDVPITDLRVFDATGREIRYIAEPGVQHTIDLSDQAPGVYFVSYTCGSEKFSRKMLMQ